MFSLFVFIYTPAPPCLNITLPLKSNVLTVGYDYYVKAVNPIFFNDAFDASNNSLIIPALANNDIGNYFRLSLRFQVNNNWNQQMQALINNNYCSNNGTYKLYLNGNMIVASMKLLHNSVEQIYELSETLVS